MAYSVSLRRLILWLCVLSIVVAAAISLYAGHRVQRDLLVAQTLESNRAYAAKLASTTQSMLLNALSMLEVAAARLAINLRPDPVQHEVDMLWLQSSYFNSVLVVDRRGVAVATAPHDARIVGKPVDAASARAVLSSQKPWISLPFRDVEGRWTITVSQPIVDAVGRHHGYVAGTIHLHDTNILHSLLGEQLHGDGSYVYVVDSSGVIIYHPERDRVGERVSGRNAIAMRALAGETGAGEVLTTRGVQMVAGFAPVPLASWGVVAQRSLRTTLASMNSLLWQSVQRSLPFLILLLVGVWWLSALVSRPLSQMARLARDMESRGISDRVAAVNAWYFEAAQLRRALVAGLSSVHGMITSLRAEGRTDALTNLLNRRGTNDIIEELAVTGTTFGAVYADIDRFKVINDTHGHAAGDDVLQRVAAVMRENLRLGDVLCRVGGEEFLLLSPQSSLEETQAIAERLRLAVQTSAMPHCGSLTISLGVSHFPELAPSANAALAAADEALYAAKRGGRNRVHTSGAHQIKVSE